MDQAFLCITVTSCFNHIMPPLLQCKNLLLLSFLLSHGQLVAVREVCVCVTASDVFSSLLLFLQIQTPSPLGPLPQCASYETALRWWWPMLETAVLFSAGEARHSDCPMMMTLMTLMRLFVSPNRGAGLCRTVKACHRYTPLPKNREGQYDLDSDPA